VFVANYMREHAGHRGVKLKTGIVTTNRKITLQAGSAFVAHGLPVFQKKDLRAYYLLL
jgi:hypothetical protein